MGHDTFSHLLSFLASIVKPLLLFIPKVNTPSHPPVVAPATTHVYINQLTIYCCDHCRNRIS